QCLCSFYFLQQRTCFRIFATKVLLQNFKDFYICFLFATRALFHKQADYCNKSFIQKHAPRKRRSPRASPDGGEGGSAPPVPAFAPPPVSTGSPTKVTSPPSSSSFRFLHLSVSHAAGAPFAGVITGPCCEARRQPRKTSPDTSSHRS
uniref:Uncharacterized protein n=1 Tax=Aegilops tauschii subsp. strangulata TaxID=200361 RepID=A0A453PRB3_AEGTS